MRYRIYQLTEPYGEPGECLYETEERMECMRKVAELLRGGEGPDTIRVISENQLPTEQRKREVWRYLY